MQTKQHLHKGPIHVPSSAEPASWDFAIEIPRRPSPLAVKSEMKDPEASYLPLDAGSIAKYPLPSTFATKGHSFNTNFDAYVEYHLEATLLQQGSGRHGGDNITAMLPIRIVAPPMPYPLTDFDLRRRSAQFAASSYRLVPGMETVGLTFKQKSKKFFGSSKVPMFGFTLQYDSPGVIQLGNSTPIPFRVRVVPDGRRTSEVLQGVPQVVTLSSLDLVLKADTFVIAPGTFHPHTADDAVKHHIHLPVAFAGNVSAAALKTVDRGVKSEEPAGKEAANAGAVHRPVTADEKPRVEPQQEEQGESSSSQSNQQPARHSNEEAIADQNSKVAETPAVKESEADSSSPPSYEPRTKEPPPPAASAPEKPPAYQTPKDLSRRGPLVIPSAWGADGAWLDVGAAIDLRLHETYVTALGRTIAGGAIGEPICPGFTTYCIRHSHRLKWKMGLAVGGEAFSLEGEGPVTVVGAAESG